MSLTFEDSELEEIFAALDCPAGKVLAKIIRDKRVAQYNEQVRR